MKDSALASAILLDAAAWLPGEGKGLDEGLVERARDGDHAAFERLAAAAADRLYAIAHRVLRDPVAAEDAVQDCLIRAWRDLRALRDPSRWDAWLYRLLLNACRDQQRSTMRRPITLRLSGADPAATDAALGQIETREAVERGLLRLSAEHRMVLALHHYLGLRPVEIAGLLGLAEGTVSSRIHYAGRALRGILGTELRASDATGPTR